MSFLGKLVSTPLRVVNLPLKAIDSVVDRAIGGTGRVGREDRTISYLGEELADFVEDVVDAAVEGD